MKWDHIPSAPKWGTFDIGAPSAPNGALNGALNGGTKLDIFQKKSSPHKFVKQLKQLIVSCLFVPLKCGTFMFVPHVPQMWYKCGTQKGPHTFFRWFGYYALNVCIYPWKFWNKVFTILNFDFWWPLTSHTCIDIIIFILHTYPSAPKWGHFFNTILIK